MPKTDRSNQFKLIFFIFISLCIATACQSDQSSPVEESGLDAGPAIVSENVDPTVAPTATPVILPTERPTEIPAAQPAATEETAVEAPIDNGSEQAGETFTTDAYGYSLYVPGSFVSKQTDSVLLLNESEENPQTFISFSNGLGTFSTDAETTFNGMLAGIVGSSGTHSEFVPVTVNGVNGLRTTYETDREGEIFKGAVMLLLDENDSALLVANSPAEAWDGGVAAEFETIASSIELFEPTAAPAAQASDPEPANANDSTGIETFRSERGGYVIMRPESFTGSEQENGLLGVTENPAFLIYDNFDSPGAGTIMLFSDFETNTQDNQAIIDQFLELFFAENSVVNEVHSRGSASIGTFTGEKADLDITVGPDQIQGRVIVVQAQGRTVVMFGGALSDYWETVFSQVFDVMALSVELFEPVTPE